MEMRLELKPFKPLNAFEFTKPSQNRWFASYLHSSPNYVFMGYICNEDSR